MRSVLSLSLTTLASALLAQVCNPWVLVSPVSVYGMQERFSWGELGGMVVLVIAGKLLLEAISRLTRQGYEGWRLTWRLLVSIIAISGVAAALFLFTTTQCSPNFLILFCLFEGLLVIGTEWFLPEPSGNRFGSVHRLKVLPGLFRVMVALAIAIPGFLVSLLWAYKRNPEVKHRVNVAQNLFQERGSYDLVPVLGDLSFRQLVDFDIDRETGDLFILERGGRLFQVGTERKEKVLLADFRMEVGPTPDAELGAYSVKLAPGSGGSGKEKLYVFFTSRTETENANKLIELDLSLEDPVACWNQRRTILAFPASGSSHNSGALEFDEEGFLFVGLGDNEKPACSQILDGALIGKILRIDPAKIGGAVSREPVLEAEDGVIRDYFIPVGNPFAGEPEIHGEIWAYGTRNPFRICWEPNLNALVVGDVGQLKWEELNVVRAGENFGWPGYEGEEVYEPEWAERMDESTLRKPFFAYRHDALNRSVVGGFFYEGMEFPELKGALLAGDNFSGNIWAIRAEDWGRRELLAKAPDFNQSGISRIAKGPEGEIWVSVMGSIARDEGAIYRLARSREATVEGPVAESRPPAEIFATLCAICHGARGDGRSAMAREFPVEMPDFTSPAWQAAANDEELIKAIAEGGIAVGKTSAMPAWRGVLSESEIEQMAAFVRSLER